MKFKKFSITVFFICVYYLTSLNPILSKESQPVGFVKVAREDVKIEREGKDVAVKKSMKLFEGDKITTAKKSLLTMYMKDGSIFTIPENTSLILEKYDVDDSKTKRGAAFKLLFGKIRGAVTSVQTKEPNVIIKTPSAVAGIRGTDIFIETGLDKKDKDKPLTQIACLSGTCMAGSMKSNYKKANIPNFLNSLFERSAFANTATIEMVQVPKDTAVSVKKDMSLKNILKTAKKIPESKMVAIRNNSPTTTNEHTESMTNQSLEIDSSDNSNMASDINSGEDTMITAFTEADKVEELKPAEIKKILGNTRVTITIDFQ